MKLSSVRDLKAGIAADASKKAPAEFYEALGLKHTPALARAFVEAGGGGMPPPDLALGVTKKGREHLIAVRTSDPALGAAIKRKAQGEADVRIITVSERGMKEQVRPLEYGLSTNSPVTGERSAGTLGCFGKDAKGNFYIISNSHVIANRGLQPIGSPVVQPGDLDGRVTGKSMVGILAHFIPYSLTTANLVDAASARLSDVELVAGLHSALGGPLKGTRALRASDLGRLVRKVGRTTGIRQGKVTSVEMDGLPVAMGNGWVPRFNDQFEISGGVGEVFSAAGDSGSLIVDLEGYALGLLFAGGLDQTGEDFTYANLILNVLSALALELVV